jgi:hypothetical protein
MQKLSISKISQSFIKTKPQKIENHQTNPFGVSYKGNILTADVFEKAGGDNLVKRISNKSKLLSSVVVGSINKINSAIGTRLNSVVSFGKRIRENVSGLWNQAKNIEISFDMAGIGDVLKSKLPEISSKNSVNNLSKLPIGELEEMLVVELARI